MEINVIFTIQCRFWFSLEISLLKTDIHLLPPFKLQSFDPFPLFHASCIHCRIYTCFVSTVNSFILSCFHAVEMKQNVSIMSKKLVQKIISKTKGLGQNFGNFLFG